MSSTTMTVTSIPIASVGARKRALAARSQATLPSSLLPATIASSPSPPPSPSIDDDKNNSNDYYASVVGGADGNFDFLPTPVGGGSRASSAHAMRIRSSSARSSIFGRRQASQRTASAAATRRR